MLSHQNSTGGGGGNHLASSNHVHGAGESSDAKRRHKSASEEGKVSDREMMTKLTRGQSGKKMTLVTNSLFAAISPS